MGNLNCCETSENTDSFRIFCIEHSSPQYKSYIMGINKHEPSSENNSLEKKKYILGNWKEQPKSGKGIIYSPEMFYYEGDILDAKATGNGKIIWPSHTIYNGSVLQNKANGQGTLTFEESYIQLQGEWQSGLPKTNQPMSLVNKGKKANITFLQILNSQSYSTEIQSILVSIEFDDRIKYLGPLKLKDYSYKMEGKGKITYADGSYFEGDLIDGKMHGNGKYFWESTGHWYEGEYKFNFKDGLGKYYFDSNNFRQGVWKGGILQLDSVKQMQQ